MGTLLLFNFILILIITAILFVAKRWGSGKRAQQIWLLATPIVTILCHYSMLFWHLFTGGDVIFYLFDTPNLILPMYPCNIVMWCALIYGLLPNKESRFGVFLSDYLFWFGLFSTLVGMFANVDFILNPTLRDFEVTKSILAHGTLLFNVLLIPVFGRLRPRFFRNMCNMVIGVVAMYAIGLYCTLIFRVFVSAEMALDQNSMFILQSPFEGLPFLRYPVIALLGLLLYFGVFTVCDMRQSPVGERWFDRLRTAKKKAQ